MKRWLVISAVTISSIAITAGIVYAATTTNVTSQFGATGNIFQVDGTWKVSSMMVGAQGVGGVTYFNGTIINNTTNAGADNPVTFGDNVRIDGRVYRGATAGTTDSMPFIVNDNMEVLGSLTIGSLVGTDVITSDNITDGVVATADLADDAVTSAKVTDSSITSAKITDATIATADIADDAVTPAKINGTGGANLPIAYGYCDSNGDTRGGTSNITCSWDGVSSIYKITITGENYYFNEYITLVTSAAINYIPETNSVNNQLIVDFEDDTGASGLQTDFAFVVYKI